MVWIVFRIGGAITSALVTAMFFAFDIYEILPDKPWSFYALIAFSIFVMFVVWGWGNSEFQRNNQKKIRKYLTALSKLRGDGIVLQNEGWHQIRHETYILYEWWKRVVDWQEEVKENMVKIHPADPDNWVNLGIFTNRSFKRVSEPLAIQYLTMLTIRLEKLEKYINAHTK
jgi:hypothetical protein